MAQYSLINEDTGAKLELPVKQGTLGPIGLDVGKVEVRVGHQLIHAHHLVVLTTRRLMREHLVRLLERREECGGLVALLVRLVRDLVLSGVGRHARQQERRA